MDPSFIAIGMLDMDPVAFLLDDPERDPLSDGKKNPVLGPGAGADIAIFLDADDRGRLLNQ